MEEGSGAIIWTIQVKETLSGFGQGSCWSRLLAMTQGLAIPKGKLWALGTILASSKSGSCLFQLEGLTAFLRPAQAPPIPGSLP